MKRLSWLSAPESRDVVSGRADQRFFYCRLLNVGGIQKIQNVDSKTDLRMCG